MKKAWLYVGFTSFFELVWILGFNIATEWWHWGIIVILIFIDFHFLTKACELLPTGTVYACFAAIGTIGTALLDIFFFDEVLTGGKVFFMVVLVAGVISLKLADNHEEQQAKGSM